VPLHTSLESRHDNRPGGESVQTTGEAGKTVDAALVDTARANQGTSASWAARLLLPVILVAQLMVVLDMSIVNVALPDMQHALSFSPTGLSWVLNAYTLAFGGLLLLGARAGDLLGRRRTFMTGMTVFTAASLLGGLATAGWWLLAARTLQGVGAAMTAPAVLAFLTSTFAEGRERTRALGMYTAVSIGGAAIGLISGGILTQTLSWRWVMFVNVPIGVAVLLGASFALTETPRQTGKFDLPGAFLATLGTTSLVYGFVRAASDGWRNAGTVAALAAGVVLIGAFILNERHASSPITPLSLFNDRTRVGAYIGRLLLVASMFGMFFFLTQFMQDVLHYGPLKTGFGFLPVTIALFASSQASARVLVERFGERTVLLVGVSLSFLSMLWLTQLSETSGYPSILGPLLLLGLGNGSAFVPLTSAGLHAVEPRLAGAASGLVNVSQQVGASVGLAALVTIFGSAQGRSTSTIAGVSAADQARQAFVDGADAAFLGGAVLLGAAVVIVAVLVRRKPAPQHDVTAEADRELELESA
jgi:EmrB/QacA subfamily drug resistance transporter